MTKLDCHAELGVQQARGISWSKFTIIELVLLDKEEIRPLGLDGFVLGLTLRAELTCSVVQFQQQ